MFVSHIIDYLLCKELIKGYLIEKQQIVDPLEIEKMVEKVLSENPKQLQQYRGGKTKLQGYFAGQVCKSQKRNQFQFCMN